MVKKFLLFAFMLVPMFAMAQESQKIAYLVYSEVVQSMPEFKVMTDSLQKQATAFEDELKILNEEYEKKYVAYLQQQDTLVESIKVRRQQDIQDLGDRAMAFQQQARQSQEELQQKLFAPIQEKVIKAIQDVATENHFDYVVDANQLLFFSPKSPNATPLVKAKLGIK